MNQAAEGEKEVKFELKPHLFKAYLKAIGFKLLYVINDLDDDITDMAAGQKSKPLFVY